ncbi:ABC-three component system protein [Aquibacillus sediminis]|uniref:ABC-three component system protein n=1 Tax=Aquibacillus sediminis TaxID=2574734 RepID=UPI00110904AB|nr:ABC-three component system protein [Aquibacillus sediminis]
MIGGKNSTAGPNSPIFANQGDVYQQVLHLKSETINPYNLKKVIEFLENELQEDIPSNQLIQDDEDLKRINIVNKNYINNLEQEGSTDYFDIIIESSIYFKSIKDVLSNPRNNKLRKSYNNIKKTINNKIPDIKRRKEYFSEVLNEIIDRFFNSNDETIMENEELVSVIVHFMYFICHVGDNDAKT